MKLNVKSLALLCLAGAAPNALSQIVVPWGTQNDDTTFTAPSLDGTLNVVSPLPVTFELGIFSGTFLPTLSNVDLWDDNWVSLDTFSIANGGGTFNGSQIQFGPTTGAGSAPENIQTGDGTPYPLGAKIYIWGYVNGDNTFDPTDGISPEWVLLSNDNVSPAGPAANVATDNWLIPSSDSSAVASHGTANRDLFASEADDGSLGVGFSDDLGNITFIAVPEPSSALLALFGVAALLRRRR